MKLKILVTGGAGYIGSHTVVELYNNGFTPIIVDNLCNSTISNINGINQILNDNISWYNIDCTDLDDLNQVFVNEKDIVGCIHFASFKSVAESIINPEKYYFNNVKSLEVLLKCMRINNVKNIIFSSSCTVYGVPDVLPVSEDSPFKKAESPYGETKQICEDIINESNCNSISLRYFNPIGSHSSILIGDCSEDNASNLVPIICEVVAGDREFLIVNGNDYNTHDGTCIRDYIHVVDLAKAHVNAISYILNKKRIKTNFNVGTGKGLSVLEIINEFEKVNQLHVQYKIGPRRKGDVEEIFSNGDYIKKELDWEVNNTLSDALKSSWKWKIKNNI